MSKHTVILIRHAKAENTLGDEDKLRPLSEVGVREARDLGKRLEVEMKAAGSVFISPALRAEQTWTELLAGAGLTAGDVPTPEKDPVIYSGTPEGIAEMVRIQSRGELTIVVGHDPLLLETAALLVKDGVSVPDNMPVASALAVSASHDWKEWHSHVAPELEIIKL